MNLSKYDRKLSPKHSRIVAISLFSFIFIYYFVYDYYKDNCHGQRMDGFSVLKEYNVSFSGRVTLVFYYKIYQSEGYIHKFSSVSEKNKFSIGDTFQVRYCQFRPKSTIVILKDGVEFP